MLILAGFFHFLYEPPFHCLYRQVQALFDVISPIFYHTVYALTNNVLRVCQVA